MSQRRDRHLEASQIGPSTANLPASRDQSSVQPFDPVDKAALDIFISELNRTAEESTQYAATRRHELSRRESLLFKAAAISAFLVPILIAVGLILIIVANIRVGGAITSSAGIISGAGSTGLFRLRSQTVKELGRVTEELNENERLAKAVRLASMIRDPSQQAALIATLASDVVRQSPTSRIEIEEERAP